MEDYYASLEIEKQWSVEEIGAHLKALNRKYRSRARHKDAFVREEANELLQLVNKARVQMGDDAERRAYDAELAAYQAEEELKQPMSDVDLYEALGLTVTMPGEEIERLLDERQATATAEHNDVAEREQKLILLARRILLNPEKRTAYDAQLAERAAFAKARTAIKPVPLHVNGTSVGAWLELEKVLDIHPQEGLFLLQDGEIEAWLRWSLGERQKAERVRSLAQRARHSQTPIMEFDELLRLVNGNRPLVLYSTGSTNRHKDAVIIKHAAEIPDLADAHWRLFVSHFDYLIDWLAQYAAPDVVDNLDTYPEIDNDEIWLERLIYIIQPQHTSPGIQVLDAPNNNIDFGDLNAWSKPSHSFEIKHKGRGYLYGNLRVTADWISLETTSFAGSKTSVSLSVDKAKMQSGADNRAEVIIEPLDGRVAPIRIAVNAHQKTLWKSVTGLFGGRR